jgi:hypothetical protein
LRAKERLIMQRERKRVLLFEEDFESMRDVKECDDPPQKP